MQLAAEYRSEIPMVNVLAALLLDENSAQRDEPPDYTLARLEWEWRSGQWVMLAGPDDVLWGWQSWYRLTRSVLDKIRNWDGEAPIGESADADFREGPLLFVPSTICTAVAPTGTYWNLFKLTCLANQDAESVVSKMCKRDGRRRWVTRRLWDGTR